MYDYSHWIVEARRQLDKAEAYIIASQSCGPAAEAVAMLNAEDQALSAITSLRMFLAAIRDQQTPRAWQGDRDAI